MENENKPERYAVLLTTEGVAKLIPCDHGETMRLKTLQELVGGPIEILPSFDQSDPTLLICNEEELLEEPLPPVNWTAWLMSPLGDGNYIYGPVVLMQAEDEELVGFPLEEAEAVVRKWLYDEDVDDD